MSAESSSFAVTRALSSPPPAPLLSHVSHFYGPEPPPTPLSCFGEEAHLTKKPALFMGFALIGTKI